MNAEEKLGGMIRYLIRAPDWSLSIIAISFISVLGGWGVFSENLLKDALSGFLLFGIPAIISAFLIFLLVSSLSGSITLDRSFLLFLVTSSIIISMTSFGHLISHLTSLEITWNMYVLSLGIVSALIFVALFTTAFPGKFAISAALSSLHLLLSTTTLGLIFHENFFSVSLSIWAISIGLTALLIRYLDAPLMKSFGISGFEFVYHFLEHGRNGSQGMEEIFKKIGEDVTVPLTVLSFRSNGEMVGALAVPSVHPGPIGEIGGSNFPHLISSHFSFPLLVAHGTCNHDFNPVSRREIEKVVRAIKESIQRGRPSALASHPVRIHEGSVKLLAQRFGDSLLLVCTTSPEPTEDIDLGIGLSACFSAKSFGYENVALIDAHNCGEPYAKEILPGDKRALELIRAAEKAGRLLKDAEMHRVLAGFGSHPAVGSKFEGFGDDGVKALVVETGGFRTAYVLIDGNNMVKGLREEILGELPVDEAEVMTTDNHVANLKGGDLFIGARGKRKEVLEACKKAVEMAISNLREVEVSMSSGVVENIQVFGVGKSSQLSAIGAVTLSAGKGLAVYALLSAISLSVIAFLLF